MTISPQFLDELRARVSLAGVVGRRVRLVKRGRDHVGLCPFHQEKTPSFNVVEDKGFYHCFGCGAHGDVVGFVMQTANLAFREAVEALAGEAGLAMPRDEPGERARSERRIDLQGALEAACAFYAEQLRSPAGATALAYLRQRGLDDETIGRFRLGFAPDSRDALRRALAGRMPEELLREGGLLREPEGGGAPYDYFRNRVMFPIGDRGGRVIAFGGRVLGDGKPKYLNSPETPLFQKGRVLYGWAMAREAASRAASIVVTEGYMDVIALVRAGFPGAVAPLGTALTEAQLEELWRLAAEPILCFDGDAAGERAAQRAVERALPLLRPGLSLRIAMLPAGEDPDTLLLRQGVPVMQEVLDRARPLAEVAWAAELARGPVDTPERRAALKARLDERVQAIADRNVQEQYRRFFGERLYGLMRGRRPPRRGPSWRPGERRGAGDTPAAPFDGDLARRALPDPARRPAEVLIATLINHPQLFHEFAEEFAGLELPAPDLDRLRREIINVFSLRADLDAAALKLHLCQAGLTRTVDGLLSPQVYEHWRFVRPDAETAAARLGWTRMLAGLFRQRQLAAEIVRAERGLAAAMTEASWAQLRALNEQNEQREDGDDGQEDAGQGDAGQGDAGTGVGSGGPGRDGLH